MASFAPTADLRSGRGRTASFAPTAFPTKGNCKEFACHSIRGRLYRSKPIALQKRERKKSTVPTRHPENSSEKHRRTQPWEFPGLGPCCLLGKSLPFYFRLANGYRAVLHGTCNVLRGRAASFAPTAATTEANRNYGVFRSAGETLRKQSDIGRTASFRAYGVP